MTRTHQEHGDKGFIEDQREFFDKLITQDWDTYQNAEWDAARQLEVSEILRRIPPPRRVLDVGCGAGYHDVVFAQSPGMEQVVGIDYSPKSIEQANRHYPHANVQRETADIFDTASIVQRWGPFDLVASFQVIEHLKDASGFLEACRTCARPGGAVAVVTPNRLRFINRLRRLAGQTPRLIDPLHFTEYTPADLTQLGESIGLRPVGTFGHSLHIAFSRRLVLLNGATARGLKLGGRWPAAANVIGVVFQRTD